MIARRSFLAGLGSLLAAPAIVRVASIMPVKALQAYPAYGRSPAMDMLPELRALTIERLLEMKRFMREEWPPHWHEVSRAVSTGGSVERVRFTLEPLIYG